MTKIKAFGYESSDESAKNLLSLSEVTLQAKPEVLRELAKLFLAAANEIERDGNLHLHLQDEWSGWTDGDCDVVVVVVVGGE